MYAPLGYSTPYQDLADEKDLPGASDSASSAPSRSRQASVAQFNSRSRQVSFLVAPSRKGSSAARAADAAASGALDSGAFPGGRSRELSVSAAARPEDGLAALAPGRTRELSISMPLARPRGSIQAPLISVIGPGESKSRGVYVFPGDSSIPKEASWPGPSIAGKGTYVMPEESSIPKEGSWLAPSVILPGSKGEYVIPESFSASADKSWLSPSIQTPPGARGVYISEPPSSFKVTPSYLVSRSRQGSVEFPPPSRKGSSVSAAAPELPAASIVEALSPKSTMLHIKEWIKNNELVSKLAQEFASKFFPFHKETEGESLIENILEQLISALEGVFGKLISGIGYPWIEKQCEALASSPEVRATKLAKLADDFISTASKYATTIISEMALPVELKTIKPVALGGLAGGQKFIAGSILFKYAIDTRLKQYGSDGEYKENEAAQKFLYGGPTRLDELAMKAAANELIGATQYSNGCLPDKFIVPLQCLLDFQGYRIFAMPLLPITRDSTLVYGSRDAGITIHNDMEEVSKAMECAAEKLHLAKHPLGGRKGSKPVDLCSAGDIEVHIDKNGLERYYILDLARSMPPEDPRKTTFLEKRGQPIFYRMLRPEFLHYLKEKSHPSLSSDAFSGWGRIDSEIYNANVSGATEILLKEVVPELAERLKQMTRESLQSVNLSREFHGFGVNMRHLLPVLLHCDDAKHEHVRERLRVEITSRTLKNMLRKEMREVQAPSGRNSKMASQYSSFMLKRAVCRFFNKFCYFEKPQLEIEKSILFLCSQVKERFGSVESVEDLFPIYREVLLKNFASIMIGVLSRVGVVLRPSTIKDLEICGQKSIDVTGGFLLVESDIMEFSCRQKTLSQFAISFAENIIGICENKEISEEFKDEEAASNDIEIQEGLSNSAQPVQNQIRLRALAVDLLQNVLSNDPSNQTAASAILTQRLLTFEGSDSQSSMEAKFLAMCPKKSSTTEENKKIFQSVIQKFLDLLLRRFPKISMTENFVALCQLVSDYWCFEVFLKFGNFLHRMFSDDKDPLVLSLPVDFTTQFKEVQPDIISKISAGDSVVLFAFLGFVELAKSFEEFASSLDFLAEEELFANVPLRLLSIPILLRTGSLEHFIEACRRSCSFTSHELESLQSNWSLRNIVIQRHKWMESLVKGTDYKVSEKSIVPHNYLTMHCFDLFESECCFFKTILKECVTAILMKTLYSCISNTSFASTLSKRRIAVLLLHTESPVPAMFSHISNPKEKGFLAFFFVRSNKIPKSMFLIGSEVEGEFLNIPLSLIRVSLQNFAKMKSILQGALAADISVVLKVFAEQITASEFFIFPFSVLSMVDYVRDGQLNSYLARDLIVFMQDERRLRALQDSKEPFKYEDYYTLTSADEVFGPKNSVNLEFLFATPEPMSDGELLELKDGKDNIKVFAPGNGPSGSRVQIEFCNGLTRLQLSNMIIYYSSLQKSQWKFFKRYQAVICEVSRDPDSGKANTTLFLSAVCLEKEDGSKVPELTKQRILQCITLDSVETKQSIESEFAHESYMWKQYLLSSRQLVVTQELINKALFEAVSNYDIDTLQWLLTNGALLDAKNSKNENLLMKACRSGDLSIMKWLMEKEHFDLEVRSSTMDTALSYAVASGNVDAAKYLIERGAKVEVINAAGMSLAMQASALKHSDMVHYLASIGLKVMKVDDLSVSALFKTIEKGAIPTLQAMFISGVNLNVVDKSGNSPLICAVLCNQVAVVEWLLKRKVDYLYENSQQVSAPCLAAELGHLEIVRAFVSAGVSVDIQTSKGISMLMAATLQDKRALVLWLVDKKADLELTDTAGKTALCIAMEANLLEISKFLISRGANAKHICKSGTMLMHAARSNSEKLVSLAISKGCNLNEINYDGSTPLFAAVEMEHEGMVALLLKLGANANAKRKDGLTCLGIALSKASSKTLIDLLVSGGADYSAALSGEQGVSSLMSAIAVKKKVRVSWLIEKGCLINSTDSIGRLPLIEAVASGDTEIVSLLCEKGAELDLSDKRGNTALIASVKMKNYLMFEHLVYLGADLLATDQVGNTAFHIAAQINEENVVKYYMDKSPNYVELKNSHGYTAIMLAARNGHLNIVQFLHSQGSSLFSTADDGVNMCLLSALSGNAELLEWLLARGVDVNSKDKRGQGIVSYALQSGNKELALNLRAITGEFDYSDYKE